MREVEFGADPFLGGFPCSWGDLDPSSGMGGAAELMNDGAAPVRSFREFLELSRCAFAQQRLLHSPDVQAPTCPGSSGAQMCSLAVLKPRCSFSWRPQTFPGCGQTSKISFRNKSSLRTEELWDFFRGFFYFLGSLKCGTGAASLELPGNLSLIRGRNSEIKGFGSKS